MIKLRTDSEFGFWENFALFATILSLIIQIYQGLRDIISDLRSPKPDPTLKSTEELLEDLITQITEINKKLDECLTPKSRPKKKTT